MRQKNKPNRETPRKFKKKTKEIHRSPNIEVLVRNKRIEIVNKKVLFLFLIFLFLAAVFYSVYFINQKRIFWSGQQIVLDLVPLSKTKESSILIDTVGWTTFTNREIGWEIKHPETVVALNQSEKERILALSRLFVCNPDITTGCFYYRGDEYQDTNFEAAGVSVDLLLDKKTKEECLDSFGQSEQALGNVLINNLSFSLKSDDGFVLDFEKESRLHRIFYQNRCLEIGSTIISNLSETSVEGKKILTEADKNFLRSLLRTMVFSFKFID